MKHLARSLVGVWLLAWSTPALAQDIKDLHEFESRILGAVEKGLPATVSIQFGGFTQQNQGSGVIVRADGLVLTAAHVIHLDLDHPETYRSSRRCTLTLADGRSLRGHSLGILTEQDCGAIQIDDPPDDLPVAELGDDRDHRSGDWCLAFGHPGGFKSDRPPVLRIGRLHSSWGNRRFLRSDCSITSGDSGGPLFDLDGRLIGVHSRIQEDVSGNFHARMSSFLEGWEQLIAPASVQREGLAASNSGRGPSPAPVLSRPRLGVRVRNGQDDVGAVITEVVAGGAAERAGLQVGDRLVEFDGAVVSDSEALLSRLARCRFEDRVQVSVLRAAENLDFEVTLSDAKGGFDR